MRQRALMGAVVVLATCTVGTARAVDVPIPALKLIIVDKTAAAGKAKAVFVAKDASIAKGTGTDPMQIEATLDVAYDAVRGSFVMPAGSKWLVNSDSVGKYVNKDAPAGGAVKVSVIKPASLVKVVGKSLGDTPLDISNPPTGSVYLADTIVNGGEETRLCTQFRGCVHKPIAGGSGRKLICRGNSAGDPACTAVSPATTTSTSSSSTSSTFSTTTSITVTTLVYTCSVAGGAQCGGSCPPGYTCANVTGLCGCTAGYCGTFEPTVCSPNTCPSPGDCLLSLFGFCLCGY